MKDLVFNYNLKSKSDFQPYGTSVGHVIVEHTLKPEVHEMFPKSNRESWEGHRMKSEMNLIVKFKELIRERKINKVEAEKLLELIAVYGDDRATNAVDDEIMSNSEDL